MSCTASSALRRDPDDATSERRSIPRLCVLWGAGFALVILVLGLVIFGDDLATLYVKNRIESAATPADELAAFRLMNSWAHRITPGYSVTAEDEAGNPVDPTRTGKYDKVIRVEIHWGNGVSVRKMITYRGSLDYVYGE